MGNGMAFRLLGFPVRIEWSFLLVVGLLGYSSSSTPQLDRTVAFVVIAVVAVLIHELGHALAARSQGAVGVPSISLVGMAGLTRYRLASTPGRLRSIFISVAGPAAGVLAGIVVLVVRRADLIEETVFVDYAFDIALFTTFGWSAFNLLPIVPLDGGHIMTDLLPGDPMVRRRRAAVVSIVVAAAAGIWLFYEFRLLFGPLILGFIAMSNVSVLRGSRRADVLAPPPPGPPPRGASEADVSARPE